MKTSIWIITLVLSSFAITTNSNARPDHSHHHKKHNTIRIEVGEGEGDIRIHERDRRGYNHKAHRYYNRDLRRRVRQLEEAFRLLQDEVDDLRRENRELRNRDQSYACYIKTPFEGTFLGKGATLVEATAAALNKCERKATSWCNERKVKCDKA